ncbi:MAG: exopolyphosphatase [Planctomycetota bacterium]|nr:MAG: exopolyphosphatase [Planctomycetota bacterium]
MSRPEQSPLIPDRRSEHFAAIDLGSNSFHMIVERRVGVDRFEVLDRIKEPVRLAEGLSRGKGLSPEAERRALDCLIRFGERVRGFAEHSVRAVGTSALRRAKQADLFLAEAQRVLGHGIEIVSGREEARLVYLGVCRDMGQTEEERLVFDIGGGSTEIVRGLGMKPQVLESANMGCVGFSEKFFPGGQLSAAHFDAAVLRARLELRPLVPRFGKSRPSRVLGASGTVRSIGQILEVSGLGAGSITFEGLTALRKRLIDVGQLENLQLPGLSKQRRPVLPGGLAILLALCEDLGFEEVEIAGGALREGLLYDLAKRWQQQDPRAHSIRELLQRFRVDVAQGQRVARTAERLWEVVRSHWGLDDPEERQWLHWAAELHEIGLGIAHPGYHKHGAYIISHSDMPGFSRQEQEVLAVLIGSHRRTLRSEILEGIANRDRPRVLRLIILLRLAFLLHRSREQIDVDRIGIEVTAKGLRLSFDAEWRAARALTIADLSREARKLRKQDFELVLA